MSKSVVLRSTTGFQISSAGPKGVVGNTVGFYEERSPPKFMVWTSTLEFYGWIQNFKLFFITGKQFYPYLLASELNFFIWPSLAVHFQLAMFNHTQVKPCNFQLDEQILYTASFYYFWCLNQYSTFDWDENFAVDTQSAHFASHRVKFQIQLRI